MAASLVKMVEDKLSSLINDEIGLLWGFDKEMKKLKSNFSAIHAVLQDAELKQHLLQGQEQEAIKDWLRKLKDASYQLDDILDECATEANRLEHFRPDWLKKVCLPFLTCFPFGINLFFCLQIGHRMKKISERLDDIAQERTKFHLSKMEVDKRVERQTGSFLTQPHVYGRDVDKEKIVQVLINHVNGGEDLLVYPIIGIGGIGKTTLAQFVFNDDRMDCHFETKIWVCVSEDFDVRRILKEIIKSATKSSACENLELDPLQRLLQEKLNGKRYLLVLDDVWNENQDKWETLNCILKICGVRGASIITTTRLEMVASIMRTHPSHSFQLTGLSENDCWLLFKQRAFGSEREEHPNLVEIGREIVKKCAGVPLAALALGSLMRFKKEVKEWVYVKDSEIWNLPQDEKTSILPALRLSYYNLPLELRRCFAYCSVFEKDTEIEKTDTIHLWMANGFVSSPNRKKEMEDIGNEIWNELCCRSFFQDVKEDELEGIVTFKMHDLMHDLAHSVMDEECQIVEVGKTSNGMSNERIHYLNLIACSSQLSTMPKELQNVDSLRTLLCTEKVDVDRINSELSIFENHIALRAFAARGSGITRGIGARELASSICSLRHLRYLRLYGKGITTLPDSICILLNLQTLNLYGCSNLERLPENMRCLRNLRHLLIDRDATLIKMPSFISELTCLKTLSKFRVEEMRGCGLDELQCLNHGGSLIIESLTNVKNLMEAKNANLKAKQNLYSLELSWMIGFIAQKNSKQLLEALQPHPNLQKLSIEYFKGTHFPPWIGDCSSLKSIVEMKLIHCRRCLQLPSIHQLPSLKILFLDVMHHVEYIIDGDNSVEEHNDNAVRGFPCLEKLEISRFPKLRGLSKEEEEGRGPLFPRLRELGIRNCPKLTTLPPYLSALEELSIHDHPNLTSQVLSDLLESLTSLRSLSIKECPNLTSITTNFPSLTKLQSMEILGCPELTRRYKARIGEDWHQIAHIPRVFVRD